MEYLYEGLTKIVEERGVSVLSDKYLANMMADYQVGKEIPAYDVILKLIQTHGYMCEILDYHHRAESNTLLSKLHFYATTLSAEAALKISSIKYVLDCIAYSLGLVAEPITPAILNRANYNPLGDWQFNFRSEKTQLLIIRADGTAITGNNTKYNWVQSNDEIKIFIPNTVSYEGWFIDEDTIQGNAHSMVFNRSWAWNAKRSEYVLSLNNLIDGRWVIVNNEVDLEDNIITFNKNATLHSELYDEGNWHLEDGVLTIITANAYIRYRYHSNKGRIEGVATNRAGITWKCELNKLETE